MLCNFSLFCVFVFTLHFWTFRAAPLSPSLFFPYLPAALPRRHRSRQMRKNREGERGEKWFAQDYVLRRGYTWGPCEYGSEGEGFAAPAHPAGGELPPFAPPAGGGHSIWDLANSCKCCAGTVFGTLQTEPQQGAAAPRTRRRGGREKGGKGKQ